ncbi:hypothetical protein Glove_707g109 [Diversispora epigaea]|uniref:Uncharacterized protein n=1 Tax=Diversispora epigaea TaxID=1348612 RepID=A0A397G7L9_9GLOM|nr:hypothetical protein Glove_707g109 [Diversispora epigaea]
MKVFGTNNLRKYYVYVGETRWNSSYLAWKCLIKIKNLVEIMVTIMIIDPDPSTKYNGRRLRNINLIEEEWFSVPITFVNITFMLENLKNIHEYLRLISDIETRWNSSYLAWKCLIKIKNLVEIMVTIMIIDPDPSTKYNGRRLRNINLIEEECILEIISQKLLPDNSEIEIIDLIQNNNISRNTAFDNNISYTDTPEDDTEEFKKHEMLVALLDPRFKDLEFASEVVRTKTLKQIKKAYQNIKNLINNNQEIEYSLVKSNSFLARMFQNSNNLNEVDHYLKFILKIVLQYYQN